MKKIFVSVPFAGRSKEEIRREIQILTNEYMMTNGYTIDDIKNGSIEFLDNSGFIPEEFINTCGKNRHLICLSNALFVMSTCDEVIFSKDWKKARGCRIEHLAYHLYLKEGS